MKLVLVKSLRTASVPQQLSFCSRRSPSADPPGNREADEHIGRIRPNATPSHCPSERETAPNTGTQNWPLLRKVRIKHLGRQHHPKGKHRSPGKK